MRLAFVLVLGLCIPACGNGGGNAGPDGGGGGVDAGGAADMGVPRGLAFSVGQASYQWGGGAPGHSTVVSGVVTGRFNADAKDDLVFFVRRSVGIGPDAGAPEINITCLSGDDSTRVTPIDCKQIGSALHRGNFDRDGKLDVYLEGCEPTGSVLLGNGDGSFQPKRPGLLDPVLTSADVNGDGLDDLVTGLNKSPVWLAVGDGTFKQVAGLWPAGNPSWAVAVKLDGDAHLDLLIGEGTQEAALLGNGDGTFNIASRLPMNFYVEATGDFNGDGKLDVWGGGQLALGKGDGSFGPLRPAPAEGTAPYAVADFDGDGKLDLVGAASTMVGEPGRLLIAGGRGDGTFKTGQQFDAQSGDANGRYDYGFRLGGVLDLDGNGQPDIWGNTAIFEGVWLITRVNVSK